LRPEEFGRVDKSIFSRSYEIFLRRLRTARTRAGLTQTQLAERLGQTQSFVSKCERGERRLDLVEAREFCVAIGISFPRFVTSLDEEIANLD
jgi:transcriptional regulator with XRE-family HTH domain